MVERALGAADAGGGHLQAGGAQPVIGHLEALVDFAEDLALVHPAVGELEDAVVVAPVRDVLVPGPDGEAGGSHVDQERRDQLLLAARGVFLAGGGEEDDEARFVSVADEVLRAVDDEIVAVLLGEGLHAAQVGADAGFGHGKAVRLLALDGGEKVLVALLALAGHQDVGGARHAGPVQRIIGAAELLLVEHPGEGIEASTSHFGGHVGGIEARLDGLGLDLVAQVVAQNARFLDLGLVGVKLVLDEVTRRLDDHLLFVGEIEIHNSAHLMWKVSTWPSMAMSWPLIMKAAGEAR